MVVPFLLWSACTSELGADADEPEVSGLAQALVQPVDTVTLTATADTSLRNGLTTPNKNYGAQSSLAINRSLVIVDKETLATATAAASGDYIVSAKLRLTVNSSLISLPRVLSAHRVIKPWTESGATWNCAIDSNPSNNNLDCSGPTRWSNAGGDFIATASGSVLLPLTLGSAVVEIDVTEDVREFKLRTDNEGSVGEANYGWLLKSLIDLPLDPTSIASSESSTPPQLVLQVRRCNLTVCNDGIACSQDNLCSDEGFCAHLVAPPAPCNDGDPCTLDDHCSGMDFTCVSETPAPVGTSCGSGLECDAQQQCVPVSP
jgi:hypothetical protein